MHLLSRELPADLLAVTYDDPSSLLDAWCDRVGRRPSNAGVVSVGEQMRSASASSESDASSSPTRNVIRGVADPADASGILDAMLGYLDSWPRESRSVAYFDSVTALVDHAGADAATDFLADLLYVLGERDVVGYFCLTPSAHDCATVRAITSLFDTVVECIDAVAEADADAPSNAGFCSRADADSRSDADPG